MICVCVCVCVWDIGESHPELCRAVIMDTHWDCFALGFFFLFSRADVSQLIKGLLISGKRQKKTEATHVFWCPHLNKAAGSSRIYIVYQQGTHGAVKGLTATTLIYTFVSLM